MSIDMFPDAFVRQMLEARTHPRLWLGADGEISVTEAPPNFSGALEAQIKDGLIRIVNGDSYYQLPDDCGMTSLEAEKLADELRAAARKLRNRDQRKKLGDY